LQNQTIGGIGLKSADAGYALYNTDERNALQAMEGMGLPESYMSVIVDKHQGSIYREFNRNGSGGKRTTTVGEQTESENRR
jgi:hypothetical protein